MRRVHDKARIFDKFCELLQKLYGVFSIFSTGLRSVARVMQIRSVSFPTREVFLALQFLRRDAAGSDVSQGRLCKTERGA